MMYRRSKWDRRFMRLASMVATWSKDPDHQVGAVIVDSDRHIQGLGFNGPPKHVKDTKLSKQQKQLRSLHAELNAILNCKESTVGSSIYVYPYAPCAQCAAAIIQKGIITVYYNQPIVLHSWRDSQAEGEKMLREAGIELICLWLQGDRPGFLSTQE